MNERNTAGNIPDETKQIADLDRIYKMNTRMTVVALLVLITLVTYTWHSWSAKEACAISSQQEIDKTKLKNPPK